MKSWLALALLVPAVALAQPPRIALIIDDMGYNRTRGEAVLQLPAAVTCAVIPEAPWSPALARQAIAAGKEVMLHLPMATDSGRPLDKGGLRDGMSAQKVRATVRAALERIPQAVGANNHMGSTVTRRPELMLPLMKELASQNRYFIDSLTTPDSVAAITARDQQLPTDRRDIFLDNETDELRINEQFNKLLAVARRRGHAIGIAHPYPETLSYLKKVLPLLSDMDVEMVPVSRLLADQEQPRRKLAERQ